MILFGLFQLFFVVLLGKVPSEKDQMRNEGGQEKLMEEPLVGCIKKDWTGIGSLALILIFFSIPVTDVGTQIKYNFCSNRKFLSASGQLGDDWSVICICAQRVISSIENSKAAETLGQLTSLPVAVSE